MGHESLKRTRKSLNDSCSLFIIINNTTIVDYTWWWTIHVTCLWIQFQCRILYNFKVSHILSIEFSHLLCSVVHSTSSYACMFSNLKHETLQSSLRIVLCLDFFKRQNVYSWWRQTLKLSKRSVLCKYCINFNRAGTWCKFSRFKLSNYLLTIYLSTFPQLKVIESSSDNLTKGGAADRLH